MFNVLTFLSDVLALIHLLYSHCPQLVGLWRNALNPPEQLLH